MLANISRSKVDPPWYGPVCVMWQRRRPLYQSPRATRLSEDIIVSGVAWPSAVSTTVYDCPGLLRVGSQVVAIWIRE